MPKPGPIILWLRIVEFAGKLGSKFQESCYNLFGVFSRGGVPDKLQWKVSEEMFQNTKELYLKMSNTPDLCGQFKLDGDTILWKPFDGYTIHIVVDPRDNYFTIEKKMFWKITEQIIHWHPDTDDIYEDVCNIGLKGNVLVIRKNWFWSTVLYMGKEANCPYFSKTKWSWGKIYYLRAK